METTSENVLRRSFTASDGAEISYLDVGEGTPLLWIHGWGGDASRQQEFLKVLSRFGFRGLCFDQRGCGESKSVKDLGISRSAQDTKELLEHLGIDDVVLLGYSMGAAVLFSYVEQFGSAHVSRFIIGDMSPKPLNDPDWHFGIYQGWYTPEQMQRDLYNMEHDYPAFAAFFAEQTIFPHTPEEARSFAEGPEMLARVRARAAWEGKSELLEYFVDAPEERQRWVNRIYWESCDSRDFRPVLGKIDVPTGLFFARPGSLYDPRTAEWMAERIPDAYVYIFDGCTHLASGEKPLEFINAIVDFLDKTGGR